MSKHIFILNGPNLNLLGTREPEIYGSDTLEDVEMLCKARANELNLAITFRQSNIEGELVGWVQEAGKTADALIFNPAAYTHTSVALFDALKAVTIPCVEIHISQPTARESFRKRSYVGAASIGTISGFGINSYLLALDALKRELN